MGTMATRTVEYESREPWLLPRAIDGWTVDLLEQFPDDGFRYELVDGMLLVTPAPFPVHQIIAANLCSELLVGCPSDLRVIPGPVDIRSGDRTSVQPDVLVVPRATFTAAMRRFTDIPLLVVEIASRSTRRRDRLIKPEVYAEVGVPSYWLIDPDEPTITELRLDGDSYVEHSVVRGAETFASDAPYPASFVPERLRD